MWNGLRGFIERLRRSHGRPRAVVTFDDTRVVCRRPHGLEETVGWDELERVEILTTDGGPYVDDVFWVLHGRVSGCVVPSESEGVNELLQRLQALPGFDNQGVIAAMGSVENATFLCWRRPVD